MSATSFKPSSDAAYPPRVLALFNEQWQSIIRHTDRLFLWLMIIQWFFAVVLAVWISPRTWNGPESTIHPHVWIAIFLGAIITSAPVVLAWRQPGKVLTRHTIAIAQMLMSALLIHLTGGRIETHFHVFGSLAILAFYRDWPVLISASVVVYVDHLLRGFFIPQSVYGVVAASYWRSFEHAGWVAFEVIFLLIAIRKSLQEMLAVAERQAKLEEVNATVERAVAERTAELTQAQQIAKLGNWEWDILQDKTSWSSETQRIYGHQPDDFGGKTMQQCIDERVHPDDLARVRQVMAAALKTGQPFVCEHRICLPDGTERVAVGRGEVLLNDRGEPMKMLGVVQDITEAKRAQEALRRSEEQLRQSQKMEAVGRLAGGVAHDFNNLLMVINGYSAMTLQQMDAVDPLRKNLEETLKAGERASALTRQLLAFSRKQVLQPRVLDLNDVVGGMEKMLRRLIGEHVELHTAFETALGHVKADPGQIEQVILNLAINARDAMPRGGRLTIRTSNVSVDQKTSFRNRELNVGEYVMLSVTDSGIGMSEDVKAHLFEPFFTTKGVGKGTGLGLATCYGIIAQSHGDIRVYSEPDQGTTFKIYLPRTNAPLEPPDPDAESRPDGTESLLVVEDDRTVRTMIVTALEQCGYQIQEAGDGMEALPLLEQGNSFDLLITDVIMPRMSGKELYDEVKKISPGLKVLFISGYTDDVLAPTGVLGKGISFLEKPFSPARLARKVREILDGREEKTSHRRKIVTAD